VHLTAEPPELGALRRALAGLREGERASLALARLVHAGLDRLPLPGSGRTLLRWQALAAVAAHDLSLAKLYEGHTDALAILHELGAREAVAAGSIWGVWAAESPGGRAIVQALAGGEEQIDGNKCWCSGAASASHALLTAWRPDGTGPQFVRLALSQPGVEVSGQAWRAIGMADSASFDVKFEGVRGHGVGGIGDYLARPGFWHGGAGIAACWYGGAVALAETLRRSLAHASDGRGHDHRRVALGRVDAALGSAAALLREAARWIDDHPLDDAREVALRVRLAAEHSAKRVLDEAGSALGAAAFCRDARFARAAADLPVFLGQSHTDRDFEALAEQVLACDEDSWAL
jgi:alkylation response protein AidB-like acyl-CoA dehydrogenase